MNSVDFAGTQSHCMHRLVHLKGLTQLQSLNLSDTQVTDAGLERLKGLIRLRDLNLRETRVTGTGLERSRKGLAQLQLLSLGGTQVTDAGVEHCRGLTRLDRLHLVGTKVTEVGLEHLQGLTQLRSLDMSGTAVTDAGVEKLRKALPNCKITHRPMIRLTDALPLPELVASRRPASENPAGAGADPLPSRQCWSCWQASGRACPCWSWGH